MIFDMNRKYPTTKTICQGPKDYYLKFIRYGKLFETFSIKESH